MLALPTPAAVAAALAGMGLRLRAGGFPFEVRLEQPNKETIAAMLEEERIARDPSVKHYSDVEEALRELKK